MLPPAPAVAVERAEAVFEARVENATPDFASPQGPGIVRYDLEVLRQWKGELGAAVQLSSRTSSAACGRVLTVGKVYLIYATRHDEGHLTDSLCSRTRLSSTADEDLAVLGPGSSPAGSRPVAEPTSMEPRRIAPPPPDLGGPTPIDRRGCAVAGAPGSPGEPALVGLLALGGLLRARRRRSYG